MFWKLPEYITFGPVATPAPAGPQIQVTNTHQKWISGRPTRSALRTLLTLAELSARSDARAITAEAHLRQTDMPEPVTLTGVTSTPTASRTPLSMYADLPIPGSPESVIDNAVSVTNSEYYRALALASRLTLARSSLW